MYDDGYGDRVAIIKVTISIRNEGNTDLCEVLSVKAAENVTQSVDNVPD